MSKRRAFKPEFKARVVLEELAGLRSPAEICREHQISQQVFSRWKVELVERAPEIFATTPSRGDEQQRIAELEQMVGRLTMELEAAKKSLEHLDLTVVQKRRVIEMLAGGFPVAFLCRLFDCARSSYYYQAEVPVDGDLRRAIKMVAAEWPTYGYRRVRAQLQRLGWTINRKRVLRVMREMDLQGKSRRHQRRTTDSNHPFPRYPNLVQALAIVRPDQVWVSDITYIRLRSEFVYLAVIMDVFTRRIRGWNLSRGLDQSLTLIALQRALLCRRPEIHHSDQGIQYAASAYVKLLRQVDARISMTEVGAAWQNGYAERLIRTIKEEAVDLSEYQDYNDAGRQLGRFLDEVYTHKRIHSSLGYLTPAEFEDQWRREQGIGTDDH